MEIIGSVLGGAQGAFNSYMNYKMLDKQYKNQQKLIDKQNKYNSPVNQMKRLVQAGLNPNLAYGNVSTGNQTQVAEAPNYGSAIGEGISSVTGAITNYLDRKQAKQLAEKEAEDKKVMNDLHLQLTQEQLLQSRLKTQEMQKSLSTIPAPSQQLITDGNQQILKGSHKNNLGSKQSEMVSQVDNLDKYNKLASKIDEAIYKIPYIGGAYKSVRGGLDDLGHISTFPSAAIKIADGISKLNYATSKFSKFSKFAKKYLSRGKK